MLVTILRIGLLGLAPPPRSNSAAFLKAVISTRNVECWDAVYAIRVQKYPADLAFRKFEPLSVLLLLRMVSLVVLFATISKMQTHAHIEFIHCFMHQFVCFEQECVERAC